MIHYIDSFIKFYFLFIIQIVLFNRMILSMYAFLFDLLIQSFGLFEAVAKPPGLSDSSVILIP